MTTHRTQRAKSTPRTPNPWLRRGAAAVALAAVLGGVAAPVALAATPAATKAATTAAATGARGTLISVTPLAELTRDQVGAYVGALGIGSDTVRHGVSAYRLTYATITPQGRPTTATGLLVLPRGGPYRLDLVSDTHGTTVFRGDAPSGAGDFGRITPYLHAAAGRAVAAPDYLGLGGGSGSHPYMDEKSAVSAGLDMLRAARTASDRLGRPLTGDVYATGFSQGGQVAMALGRELSSVRTGFRLRGLAPMAGPYDIAGAELPGLTDGRIDPLTGVFYLSYYLTAQNKLHRLYADPAEVFKAPYASTLEGLFDGSHTEEEVVAGLPATLDGLLTPAWAEQVRHPSGAFAAAIAANDDACDWKPAAPVRLYAAAGDRDVPIANARSCAADLARHGVRAPVVDQGAGTDHRGTAVRSAPQVVRWFDALSR
ncbi:alpha/beta hydrolase [Streptomyces sp. PvR034]|uniref:alpha/beta hydrolase n=1 Tax=Streptomyces sp. PvR034 TaxID=3156401 RepID=UPI00339A8D4F